MTRVTVLCSDLSTNCVMRGVLLADLLRDDFEVSLTGLDPGPGLWPPAHGLPVPVTAVPVRNVWQLGWRAWAGDLVRETDALVVSKPLPTSLGPGWLAWRRGVAVVLDIDDWEVGLFPGLTGRGAIDTLSELGHEAWTAVAPRHFNARLTTRICELMVHRLPWPKLVSNRWLQARYGGDLLYHVRQQAEGGEASALASELDLGARPWVGFVGTVRSHKGVEGLVEALTKLSGSDAPGLLLAGANPDSDYARHILKVAEQRLGAERFRHLPPFPVARLADVLAACDVVCVPSRAGTASRGQVPAKLFDAMAAGCAIVATAVNDVPEVLADCGSVVPPDDASALAAALSRLLDDPALRAHMGDAARQRQAERYSYAVGRPVVVNAVRRALEHGAGATH